MNMIRLGHTFRRFRRTSAGVSGNAVPYGNGPDDDDNAPGAPPAPQPPNRVIGTSAAQADSMFVRQTGPSCIVASTTMILRQQGVRNADGNLITFPEVLFDTVQIILLPNNTVIHNPVITDPNGNPHYKMYIHSSNLPEDAAPNYLDKNELIRLFNAEQADPPAHNTERAFIVQNVGDASSRGGTFKILQHYAKTGHEGHAYSLYDIAQELEKGQYLILDIDANEIQLTDYPTEDEATLSKVTIGGIRGTPDRSGPTAHNVVLLAIDLTDPDNPTALINDPSQDRGRARVIPLSQIIAAMSDYQFDYVSAGAVDTALSSHQENRQSLMWDVANWYGRHSEGNQQVRDQAKTSAFLLNTLRSPALLKLMSKDYPDIETRAATFIIQHDRNQRAFEREYNLPEGYSDNLYGNADVLEFSKSTVQNAINTVNKKELKGLMDRDILSEVGFTPSEIDGYLNATYLRGRGFTQAEIDEILGTD